MIRNILQEINAAATMAVKNALEEAAMPAMMLAKEVYEEIPRPSAKVIFGDTTAVVYTKGVAERTCEIIAVWNAPDVVEYKLDCLMAQQVIEDYIMAHGLVMEDGRILFVDEIRSSIANACVMMRFSVTAYAAIESGEYDGGDSGEPMEHLDITTYTEE